MAANPIFFSSCSSAKYVMPQVLQPKLLKANGIGELGSHSFSSVQNIFAIFQAKIEIAQPWKTSDAISLGIIVAGLTPSEFASLDNVTLAGVTAAAVRHLTPDHFRLLTAEKLSAIPLDSMTLLRITQLPEEGSSVLDSTQVIFLA